MDGFWVIGMSFTFPLAKGAKTLAVTRPTSSLLGPYTVSSALGVLLSNTFFLVLSIAILFNQDWFKCRRWEPSDVSNLLIIGDNYESETIFLVTGYQFISTAMAYNFGYEFRENWFRIYCFVALVIFFSVLHFWALFVPGYLSCFWRVNCENENVVYSVSAQ